MMGVQLFKYKSLSQCLWVATPPRNLLFHPLAGFDLMSMPWKKAWDVVERIER